MPIDPITGKEIPYTQPGAPSVIKPAPQALSSLYDVNTLNSQQINDLSNKARAREAGEGMSQFAQAQDQIRFEELARIKNSGNQGAIDAFNASGVESDQKNVQYYSPIAALNAYLAKQKGTAAPDDFTQVSTDYNKQAIQNQGSKQNEVTQRALSLPATGNIVTSGASFKTEGVDVSAPPGTFAVMYGNGAVEFRKLPASGKIPTTQEIQGSGRAGADVGSVGKDVARTGATIQTKDGVDRKASEGNYLIEYADGKVEERKKPEGGFIPSPSQLKSGGTSTATDPNSLKTLEAEGQAALDLKKSTENVAQILARGGTAQEADEAIKKAGLTPTSELQFVGTTYRGKAASEGNAWYVDPKTKEILQRPVALSKLAKPLTIAGVAGTKIDVVDKFQSVFGREPSADELKYWVGRTDKAGSALVGAMQFAKQNGTVKSSSQDPIQAIKENANTSQQKLVANYKEAGITVKSSEKSVMKAERESLQAPKTESLQSFTTSQLTSSQFQEASNDLNTAKASLRKLDSDYVASLKGEELRGVSMTQVRRRQGAIDISYSRTRSDLLNEVQVYSDIVQSKTAMLGMMTDAFKFDSQTAQQDYTNRFNAATAMYNMTRQEEQDEFNMQQKLQDNQRANLAVVTSLLQSGNMKWDTMDADQKSQISMMEQAVGLPSGFSKFVGQTIKDPIVSFGTAYTDAGGVRRQPVYTTNPTTGNFTTKEIVMAGKEKVTGAGGSGGSGGSGRKPTEGSIARSATADMASQLNSRRGEDGYISPEDFRKSRQAWVGAGYDAKVFNNNFQYYANPGHVGDYGIPGE